MKQIDRYVLGLGVSTQSASAKLMNLQTGEVLCSFSCNYAGTVETYGAVNGVLPNAEPTIQHSDPRMWIEALDWLFAELVRRKMPLHRVVSIAVNAQQHATVYLTLDYVPRLVALNTTGAFPSLLDALSGCLSRPTSPVWLDASTGDEAKFLDQAIGASRMALLTGSRPSLRFPALQIGRFARLEPEQYAKTRHIQILSAFLASILAGRLVPNDYGDSSGSNLMNPERKTWVDEVLGAVAIDLAGRLGGEPVDPTNPVGPVAKYFADRYGVNPDAVIMPGTGDNPDSAIGTGLVEPGLFTLSLGTSTVLTGISATPEVNRNGYGHLFISGAAQYMPLLCFANGALTFENEVRRLRITLPDGKVDWKSVGLMLRQTPPSDDGGFILPWAVPEMTPIVLKPGLRHTGPPAQSNPVILRRLVEGQALAVRRHSAWMGQPKELRATGGASVDGAVLQIYADVFGAPIVRSDSPNGAVNGSALRAALGALGVKPDDAGWRSLVARVSAPVAGSTITPNPAAAEVYRRRLADYGAAEKSALAELG